MNKAAAASSTSWCLGESLSVLSSAVTLTPPNWADRPMDCKGHDQLNCTVQFRLDRCTAWRHIGRWTEPYSSEESIMNAITGEPQPVPADTQTPSAPRRARHLRRLWRPVAGLAAVIGIGVTASWWFTEGRYIESTDNAYVQGDIAVLDPRIEGDVAAIKVADNQLVHAGDPLIVLDPADWRARLAQA